MRDCFIEDSNSRRLQATGFKLETFELAVDSVPAGTHADRTSNPPNRLVSVLSDVTSFLSAIKRVLNTVSSNDKTSKINILIRSDKMRNLNLEIHKV